VVNSCEDINRKWQIHVRCLIAHIKMQCNNTTIHKKQVIVQNKLAHTAMYAFVPMKVFAMESISCKTHSVIAKQILHITTYGKSIFQAKKRQIQNTVLKTPSTSDTRR